MSSAITGLHLEQPPVTLRRVSNGAYIAVCMCGYRSRPARLISNAVGEVDVHGATHRKLVPTEVVLAELRDEMECRRRFRRGLVA